MCLVLQPELWDCQITDMFTDGSKTYQTFYYSWRLDYHGVAIRKWKYANDTTREWTTLEYCPMFHDVRHGWCIEYMTNHVDNKQREGWFHNGKRQGEHRVYAMGFGDNNVRFQYLSVINVYDNDVLVQIKKFNSTGQLMHVWNFKDGKRHGIQYNYLQSFATLDVKGEIVARLEDLHIDYNNITDADMFTLAMLGM